MSLTLVGRSADRVVIKGDGGKMTQAAASAGWKIKGVA
jgi:hypothetical protein